MGKSGNKIKKCYSCSYKAFPCDGKTIFHFPSDKTQLLEWIKVLLGDADSPECSIDYVLHNSKNLFLCPNHFEPHQFFNKDRRRLRRNVVPCKNVPGLPLSDEQMSSRLQAVQELSPPRPAQGAAVSNNSLPTRGVKRTQEDDEVDEDISYFSPSPKMICLEPSPPSTPRRHRNQLGSREREHAPERPSRMTVTKIAAASGVTRADLSPNVKKVSRTALEYHQMAKEFKRKLIKVRSRSVKLKKLFSKKTSDMIEELHVSAASKLILQGELRNFKRKPRGRDWSAEEKVFWLSFYKRSPKAYRFLKSYMTLPCEQSLKNLLSKIILEPGIMQPCLSLLKDIAMKPIDKKCVLMFDEIFLRGHLRWVASKKQVIGFEDFGSDGRTHLIADHALQFMVQGVNSQWIMPIAFYLVSKTCPTQMLKKCIKSVIQTLTDIGLDVVATISDQGPTNRGAISELKSESEGDRVFYSVNGARIVHIWDVPHLMKNIRNNLLTSDLEFERGKYAKWRHIIELFNLESRIVRLSHLTTKHLNPKGRDKMRVSLAAQVLGSHTADCMESIHRLINGSKLPDCMDTVKFIRLIDFYFDLCNGPRVSGKEKKKDTRVDVTEDSFHLQEWSTMKTKMSQWTFVRKTDRSRHVPPCLNGWMENADSLKFLWQRLRKEGLKKMKLRHLNQDPLENFFGQIRQCGGSSTDLTSELFVGALKTCLISRYSSLIRGKNCLDDNSCFLNDLKILIDCPQPHVLSKNESLIRGDVPEDLTPVLMNNPAHRLGIEKLWGSVLSSTITSCLECRQLLTSNQPRISSLFSNFEMFPSIALENLFLKVLSRFERRWRSLLFKEDVLKKVIKFCEESVNWSSLFCDLHQAGSEVFLEFLTKASESFISLKISQINSSLKAGVARFTRQATSSKNADGLRPDEEEMELHILEAELLEETPCAGGEHRTPARTPLQTHQKTPQRTPARRNKSQSATPSAIRAPIATPAATPTPVAVALPQIPLTPRQQARQKVLESWQAPAEVPIDDLDNRIRQLIDSGEIATLSVPDLRKLLKLKKLKVSGLKEDLKTRLRSSVGLS